MIAGAREIEARPFLGAMTMLCGLLMLPIIRKQIGSRVGVRLAQSAAIVIGTVSLGFIAMIGHEIERAKTMEHERRAKIVKEQERQDSIFIATYPFVNRDSLHAWRKIAADSTTNPENTLTVFLEEQREVYKIYITDSIAGAQRQHEDAIARAKSWREDSIARARAWRKDSALAARERMKESLAQGRNARLAALEQQRLMQQVERQSGPDMYNGHIVYTGPRGGRYYYNKNGNKTYIH
jgi:hypothetical protein